MTSGIWFAIGAYFAWGLLPTYWKFLQTIPATQILAHRILWSFIFAFPLIIIRGHWSSLRTNVLNRQVLKTYIIAALIIGLNWLIYVWAVTAGFIIETSLGYFINPLLSVLLGVTIFRERFRPAQWVPIGIAFIGVLYLTFIYGKLPWIAFALATTFGIYGLVKKTAPLDTLSGVALETGILFLPALIYLITTEASGQAAFLHSATPLNLGMVGAGLVTAGPLLLFSEATKRIPLSTVGLLQYIAPTIQFLLGVFVYHEPFNKTRLIGFIIVWVALVIFWFEDIWNHKSLQSSL
jgi:chloramphenicol-sensitive protein RarD